MPETLEQVTARYQSFYGDRFSDELWNHPAVQASLAAVADGAFAQNNIILWSAGDLDTQGRWYSNSAKAREERDQSVKDDNPANDKMLLEDVEEHIKNQGQYPHFVTLNDIWNSGPEDLKDILGVIHSRALVEQAQGTVTIHADATHYFSYHRNTYIEVDGLMRNQNITHIAIAAHQEDAYGNVIAGSEPVITTMPKAQGYQTLRDMWLDEAIERLDVSIEKNGNIEKVESNYQIVANDPQKFAAGYRLEGDDKVKYDAYSALQYLRAEVLNGYAKINGQFATGEEAKEFQSIYGHGGILGPEGLEQEYDRLAALKEKLPAKTLEAVLNTIPDETMRGDLKGFINQGKRWETGPTHFNIEGGMSREQYHFDNLADKNTNLNSTISALDEAIQHPDMEEAVAALNQAGATKGDENTVQSPISSIERNNDSQRLC